MHRQFPALRGLAIVLVVINHTIAMGNGYLQKTGAPPVNDWANFILATLASLGAFAVPIFLFLSGCFFAYAAGNKDIKSSYKIVQKNIPYVLIPYLIWSAIFYIEIYFLHDERFSFWSWVKNLIVGYPFNFVPLLLFYYLISPLLIQIAKRLGWILVVLITLYQIALIALIQPGALGVQLPAWMRAFAPPVLHNTLAEWAVFFPLGLVYVMRSKTTLPNLQRWKWWLAILTFGLYILALLHLNSILNAPLAQYIAPITFMLITPTISRNSIPLVRQLELFGKRAYGLYLTNLLVLDITLYSIQIFAPRILGYYLLLLPFLFSLTLVAPVALMSWLERGPRPRVSRYVFG